MKNQTLSFSSFVSAMPAEASGSPQGHASRGDNLGKPEILALIPTDTLLTCNAKGSIRQLEASWIAPMSAPSPKPTSFGQGGMSASRGNAGMTRTSCRFRTQQFDVRLRCELARSGWSHSPRRHAIFHFDLALATGSARLSAENLGGATLGARTGSQFLEGLRKTKREIWVDGERIKDVTTHPKLRGAAESLAAQFDRQHAYAAECLFAHPERRLPSLSTPKNYRNISSVMHPTTECLPPSINCRLTSMTVVTVVAIRPSVQVAPLQQSSAVAG